MSHVVVSGASRGLGRALALHLAETHDVTTFARGEPATDAGEPCAAASRIRHIAGIDMANTATLDSLLPVLAEADALVNNAGVAHDGLLATQGLNDLTDVLQVNLVATMYLTKLYVRARLARRLPGNIVTVSSIISIRGFSGLAAYSASKAGLNAMTRALAREMGGRQFRVNAVLPGYFESELSKGLSDRHRDQIIRRTPLGRLATPEDVIPVIEFLLSDESRFITGQCLVVDGGLTV